MLNRDLARPHDGFTLMPMAFAPGRKVKGLTISAGEMDKN